MDRNSGTFSGPNLEAALARAAAELSVAVSEIEHETLLGSDASGHVLIRARARRAESPLLSFSRDLLGALACPATVKVVAGPDALAVKVLGVEACRQLQETPHAVSSLSHIIAKAGEKLEPGRKVVVDVMEQEEDRDQVLGSMAAMAIERARRYRRKVVLPPMTLTSGAWCTWRCARTPSFPRSPSVKARSAHRRAALRGIRGRRPRRVRGAGAGSRRRSRRGSRPIASC